MSKSVLQRKYLWRVGQALLLVIMMIFTCIEPASAAAKSKSKARAEKPREAKIYATAVEGDQISDRADRAAMTLVLNNRRNRVGVDFSSCKLEVIYEEVSACEQVRFVFPQARVESDAGKIFVGNDVIATIGKGDVVSLNEGYELGYESTTQFIDTGFDQYDRFAVRVFLESKRGSVESQTPPADRDFSVKVSSGRKRGSRSK